MLRMCFPSVFGVFWSVFLYSFLILKNPVSFKSPKILFIYHKDTFFLCKTSLSKNCSCTLAQRSNVILEFKCIFNIFAIRRNNHKKNQENCECSKAFCWGILKVCPGISGLDNPAGVTRVCFQSDWMPLERFSWREIYVLFISVPKSACVWFD